MDDDLFSSYEQDLVTLILSVQSKLAVDAREQRGELRKAVWGRIERELEEADEIVAQMEIEVQTSHGDRSSLQSRMKEHKSSMARHRAELRALMTTVDRDDLLSTESKGHTTLDMEMDDSVASQRAAHQQRLLSVSDKLSDGQRRLEDSHRVALETEDLGAGILRDLRGQRDTLEHTRDNLYEADGAIDRASNTVKKMVNRMYQQRAVTYGIIALLVFLISFFFSISSLLPTFSLSTLPYRTLSQPTPPALPLFHNASHERFRIRSCSHTPYVTIFLALATTTLTSSSSADLSNNPDRGRASKPSSPATSQPNSRSTSRAGAFLDRVSESFANAHENDSRSPSASRPSSPDRNGRAGSRGASPSASRSGSRAREFINKITHLGAPQDWATQSFAHAPEANANHRSPSASRPTSPDRAGRSGSRDASPAGSRSGSRAREFLSKVTHMGPGSDWAAHSMATPDLHEVANGERAGRSSEASPAGSRSASRSGSKVRSVLDKLGHMGAGSDWAGHSLAGSAAVAPHSHLDQSTVAEEVVVVA
ncbi:vesicle transport through interaction with t-SNAREs 1, partial [Phenoliferia sp. Uapishka_3]